jgi:hypothetical protein
VSNFAKIEPLFQPAGKKEENNKEITGCEHIKAKEVRKEIKKKKSVLVFFLMRSQGR